MAWALYLLTVLSYYSGVSSQPWTQPASESVSLGQTAKLSCSTNSENYDIYWYQQKPGQAPRFVHCQGCNRGEGVPDRFTASASGITGHLTITSIQAEDEADYYCAKWYNSGSQYIFGGGTELSITGGSQSPPTVNLYCPSKEEMASKRTATIPCMVNDYNPSPATAIWEVGGTAVSNGVQTTKPVKDNGKYMFSSYLTVPASEWERDIRHTCKVRHKGQDYMKSVSQSQCP